MKVCLGLLKGLFVSLMVVLTDQECTGAVLQIKRKMSAGQRILPFSAALHYPSTRSPPPPGDRQQTTRGTSRKSCPVGLQVKAERN